MVAVAMGSSWAPGRRGPDATGTFALWGATLRRAPRRGPRTPPRPPHAAPPSPATAPRCATLAGGRGPAGRRAAVGSNLEERFQTLHEIVRAARANLAPGAWDYLVGGAEPATRLKRNRPGG